MRYLLAVLALVLLIGCGEEKKTPPPKPVEKKVEKKPELTEAEKFAKKTVADLNREGHLKTINFAYDQADVSSSQSTLERNAQWLKDHPSVSIKIGGHCDSRGTERYNERLGLRRAEAAKRVLVELGVSPDKITVESYGEGSPTGLGEEADRRAEFIVTGK